MTKEDEQLLLQDLIARILYGVKFLCGNNIYDAKGIDLLPTDEGEWEYHITSWNMEPVELKYIKPYLRPMSSMTEEEIIEFNNIPSTKNYKIIENDLPWDVTHYKQIEWLNKNMFDFRGLIPKNCAIAVTKENNPF